MSWRAALFAFFLLGAGFSRAAGLELAVYHTNDIHGWIAARAATFYKADPKRLTGGFAALSNLLKKDARPRLLLDAGDWFQGTPEGNLTQGQALADGFNALGYDAVEVGNHDFDLGEARLKELVRGIKCPVLGANVYRVKDHKRVAYLKPWIIKDVSGVKVGIFGLLTTNMRNLTFHENFAGLEFRREIDEAQDAVKALREHGATVVIAVTHVGFEEPTLGHFEGDKALAAAVPGIDLIVGGHTHTYLREPFRDPVHGTLIVQAGTALSQVGQVVLEIDPATKKVVSANGKLVDLWIDEVGEDPAVLKVLEKLEEQVREAFSLVVATASSALLRNRDAESALGDWMTDCEREWTHSDLAVQNSGGIRADLGQGPVTLRDIFNIMPFDNRVVNLTMTGEQVQRVLDHGVDKTKGMIQVSGASFSYNRDKDDGQRVASVLVNGKPLDPKAHYRLATVDFLARGGEGYSPFGQAEKKDFTRTLLRDVLRSCAEKHASIETPAAGRMRPSL